MDPLLAWLNVIFFIGNFLFMCYYWKKNDKLWLVVSSIVLGAQLVAIIKLLNYIF